MVFKRTFAKIFRPVKEKTGPPLEHARKKESGKKDEVPPVTEVPKLEGKTRFSDLDIETQLLRGLQDLNFEYCTPIQEQGVPLALEGADVAGKAQTGTGKTATFLIAIFNHLIRNPQHRRKPGTCRALILAPTRELAIQIYRDAEDIGKYCRFNNLAVYGGMGHKQQQQALLKPIDILAGTPGRMLDYIRNNHLLLHKTEILVIDEADRMLDMGFIPDVRRIVSRLPAAGKRQTMFFSATLTKEVLRLVKSWLRSPKMIEAEDEEIVTDLIDQQFVSVPTNKKLALLISILNDKDTTRSLVFVNRKDTAFNLVSDLQDYGICAALLSGDVQQKKRLRLLDNFRAGNTPVIIATDVAARGIHVDEISHVINFDIPYEPEDYVHRIGRTGRAGIKGKAVSFVCEYGAFAVPEIEEILGNRIDTKRVDESRLELPERKTDSRRPPREKYANNRDRGRRSGGGKRGRRSSGGRRR